MNLTVAQRIACRSRAPLGEVPGDPATELGRLLDCPPVLLPVPGTSSIEHPDANMRAVG